LRELQRRFLTDRNRTRFTDEEPDFRRRNIGVFHGAFHGLIGCVLQNHDRCGKWRRQREQDDAVGEPTE
jgi:hypothetical protein